MLAESPRGDPSSSECFSPIRYLLAPLRLLPAGATVAGRDSHPLGYSAFPRRTLILGQFSVDTDSPLQFFLDDGRLTFVVPPVSVVMNMTILLALSLLAAFILARRAAGMDPAVALRSAA